MHHGAGTERVCALPSPILDKNRGPMGPGILFSTGAGVWRKLPGAFQGSSAAPDKFRSVKMTLHSLGWVDGIPGSQTSSLSLYLSMESLKSPSGS